MSESRQRQSLITQGTVADTCRLGGMVGIKIADAASDRLRRNSKMLVSHGERPAARHSSRNRGFTQIDNVPIVKLALLASTA